MLHRCNFVFFLLFFFFSLIFPSIVFPCIFLLPSDSLGEHPTFVYDEDGKITGYKTKIGGADTVFPFSNSNLKIGTFAKYDAIGSLDNLEVGKIYAIAALNQSTSGVGFKTGAEVLSGGYISWVSNWHYWLYIVKATDTIITFGGAYIGIVQLN